MKSPMPSKADENQRKREKSRIITNVSNTKKAKRGEKKEYKAGGSIKSK